MMFSPLAGPLFRHFGQNSLASIIQFIRNFDIFDIQIFNIETSSKSINTLKWKAIVDENRIDYHLSTWTFDFSRRCLDAYEIEFVYE